MPFPEVNNSIKMTITIIIIIWNGSFRYCNECKEDTIHHVWSTIVEEPQLLIIQLKRFSNNGKKLKRKMTVTQQEWAHYSLFIALVHNFIALCFLVALNLYHFISRNQQVVFSFISFREIDIAAVCSIQPGDDLS